MIEADLCDRRQTVLRQAARSAGECIQQFFGEKVEIDHKGELDLVTHVDRLAEARILKAITQAFPQDAIVAEESGQRDGESSWQWIIDPLDGTTNFASGLPHFAVSIALAQNDRVQAGIVFDPMKNEWFEAILDGGATLNGEPIRVSDQKALGHALTATGFPYDRRNRMPALLNRIEKILMNTRGLRRLGSAALDLAYVACRRLDVFVEDGLNCWDIAAGQLLVHEAGGCITQFDGQPLSLTKGEVIACNAHLLDSVIERLI